MLPWSPWEAAGGSPRTAGPSAATVEVEGVEKVEVPRRRCDWTRRNFSALLSTDRLKVTAQPLAVDAAPGVSGGLSEFIEAPDGVIDLKSASFNGNKNNGQCK